MTERNEPLEHVLGYVLGQLIVAGYTDEDLHGAVDHARAAVEAVQQRGEAEDE